MFLLHAVRQSVTRGLLCQRRRGNSDRRDGRGWNRLFGVPAARENSVSPRRNETRPGFRSPSLVPMAWVNP